MKIDTQKFKKMLEQELILVEKELKSVGRKNPSNLNDWEATAVKMDVMAADSNEVANSIDAYEDNTAILKQLEVRFNEIKEALKRIEAGEYGMCTVDQEPIEIERLEANPAATTCKKHLA